MRQPFITILVAIILALTGYGGYRYYMLNQELNQTKKLFNESSQNLENAISKLQTNLASSTVENRDLNDLLTIIRARNTDFQNEITEKTEKVATLEKIVSTDKELLQKYSKVYFLNENYFPTEISLIEPDFIFNKTKPIQIHTKVKGRLEEMMQAARSQNIDISVLSGYRSFGAQASLKSQYKVVYGSGANSFSADQGYSEHQLGTTVDFTTKKTGETLSGFDKTPAYKWLMENAYKYGFILSYPANNKYYIFEPWHWRFVGTALAKDLHDSNKNFYSMDQRDIDAYLSRIFD